MTYAAIFACSHRHGNSDHAAELLARGVQDAGGKAEILYIRDHDILPCLACGYCDTAGREGVERCVLGQKDQAWELFGHFFTARAVLFASPIYFYHLPSRFKTWIDRGQQFWQARLDNEPWVADMPARTAHAVLVAGQPSGEKLFDGARLTLKYFVQNFNMDLAAPLTFRGVDSRKDLGQRTDHENQIIELGRKVWNSAD
ncbi:MULTISPECIES: flavodoxin family protein [unclassified Pseudodesulfovibrio]|uniref:flavodoxin family protein n=1 Tax=unclassified Pseudodesulfovibrio TaxID=2661612 RepID=UPI000FEB80F4|nr:MULTISPECIES: flavodoxin family protein [unclassified Pseudodesulfovibrio]MCJ2163585.1 flavodoxin family protein [Pseudodesulfovibrio sp. S3-i]RWU06819.1 flavodoxin family protein [Pseudodesulfovibrio sp. S3]